MDLPKTHTSTTAAPSRKGLHRTLAVTTMTALLLGAAPAVTPALAAPAPATSVQAAPAALTASKAEAAKTYAAKKAAAKKAAAKKAAAKKAAAKKAAAKKASAKQAAAKQAAAKKAAAKKAAAKRAAAKKAAEAKKAPSRPVPAKPAPAKPAPAKPAPAKPAPAKPAPAKPAPAKPAPAKPAPAKPAPTKPAPANPGPANPGPVNATNGSGGTYRDVKALAYSNGESTSNYHVYAGHLDGKKPHGILFYLHGDGAVEYQWPEAGARKQYIELARKHNLMLVMPRTPDQVGSYTWWEGEKSVKYAADLLDHLGTKYNLDLNQVYWTGLSGGSDVIAGKLMNDYSDGWTGGAAVMVAGGGAWRAPAQPISASLKSNFTMHWVVGSRDTPAAGGASGNFNAVAAAQKGHAHYQKHGLITSLTIVPGLTHFNIGPHGPAKLAEILERR